MKSLSDSHYFMRRFIFPNAALLLAIATHCIPLIAQTRPTANTILVDDTFADGNSQNQDLSTNSIWLFNGRTTNIRTDKVGSVTFDVTPNGGSSEGFWGFFTKSGTPVNLSTRSGQ